MAAVIGAAASAEVPRRKQHSFFPPGTSGVVVLDLSQSISVETFQQIGATLSSLVASGGRSGLVVFSDDAYEVLPPGTPTQELRPVLRYFQLPKQTPGQPPTFPINPWSRRFTAGTHISTGLELAREVIVRDRIRRPAVLLVSDLADDAADLPAVSETLIALRRRQIPLKIVGLHPYPTDLHYFENLIGQSVSQSAVPRPDARDLEAAAGSLTARFPRWLVVLACVTTILLVANELWLVRITWDRPAETETS